ncbi:hypothetical protein QCA50_011674 [Cerrena zonata]|uniref:Uncharacterized protein n=1 Tax=Cerrena zonata TaxID=2478898 RepID=A0AAW0FWM2_9APHY
MSAGRGSIWSTFRVSFQNVGPHMYRGNHRPHIRPCAIMGRSSTPLLVPFQTDNMGVFTVLLVVLVALAAMFYQTVVSPLVKMGGFLHEIEPLNNRQCHSVPELEGCEKIVLFDEQSILYLACSRISGRPHWLPNTEHLNVSGKPTDDYIATYNLETGAIVKLRLEGFGSPRGISVHGMDVVPSSSDSKKLYVYLVNHRAPSTGKADVVGADSVMEIFETHLGSDVLHHVKTVEDPVIETPNDVVGSPDGKSFWFTNDHWGKTGFQRTLELYFMLRRTTVGYCHVDEGCKFAAKNLPSANGIARSPINDTFYVASGFGGGLQILEKQTDNTLVLTDVVPINLPLDNLAIDTNGALWIAFFPRGHQLHPRFKDTISDAASGAFRLTQNTGQGAFFGEKYRLDRMFEDSGRVVEGATSVTYSSRRKLLIMHGISATRLALCKV